MSRWLPWAVLVPLAIAACAPAPVPAPVIPQANGPEWFADITDRSGISFRHSAGRTESYFMPAVMGSGLALADFDGDGRLDLLALANGGPRASATHKLFRQKADGTFEDMSAGSGLDFAGHGMGVAVGDWDNDGRLDLYLSQYGGGRLFRNRGDGKFEDVTDRFGVALPRWGTSCAFVDFDRDGWLDLAVANYVDYDPSKPCIDGRGRGDFCHPNQFAGTAARLFRNLGDGRFQDVTVASGLAAKPSNGLGIACADFTGDGWPDLLIANDAQPNHLWVNQKNGTFADEAALRGLAYDGAGNVRANMGVAVGDFHGDGRADVFVTHLAEELHTLWRQDAPGRFRDATARAGLARPRWRGTGFGVVAADFDRDGHLDLAIANGRVMRARAATGPTRDDLPPFWRDYAERNQLFAGLGEGRFRDDSANSPAFAGIAAVTRGLAWGDLDNDGAIDLVTSEIEGPIRVYRNVAPNAGHWLAVRAIDPRLQRDAIGAVVTVRAGARDRVAAVNPAQSYCSAGDLRAHFGLGAATTVDEILVDWPDGTRERFPGCAADREVKLERGRGRP
jgi:enediyne biosynthesis protein E4